MVDSRAWGIEPGYWDASGQWHDTAADTVDALLAVMGADGEHPPTPSMRVVEHGHWIERPDGAPWTVHIEGGGQVDGLGSIYTSVLPTGYHQLDDHDASRRIALTVAPGACPWPSARQWGVAVQLYSVHSRRSQGIGDFADVARLGQWARREGAGFLLLSPVHATPPSQPSPYSPSSRIFRDPVYLDCSAPARAVGDLVDRVGAWRHKRPALRAEFEDAPASPRAPDLLQRFGVHQALRDHFDGAPWPSWPVEFHAYDSAAVTRFAADHDDDVRFHIWLQARIDEQLGRASQAIPLFHDLAVGCDAGGADTWMWPSAFAIGARVGAPPDEFNTAGQDWGLPPFDPWRLGACGYEPFIEMVRANLRHAAGLRVDHVMGLFRLFWIPPDGDPSRGAYVRYPAADLLGLLALEATRAGSSVVGEDLGTVEDHVRDELRRRRILSYRLTWFEPEHPGSWAEPAMGAVSTHDLPTVAGLWHGADGEEMRSLGLDAAEASTAAIVDRLRSQYGLEPDAPVLAVRDALYGALAASPAVLVTATLEDALAVERRPNLPGTIDERPNWRLPLPASVEEIEERAEVADLTRTMREGRE